VNFTGVFCSDVYEPQKKNFAAGRTAYARFDLTNSATPGTRVATKLLKLLNDNFKHCPAKLIVRYHNICDKNLEHDKKL
jgi:hypothetical protein